VTFARLLRLAVLPLLAPGAAALIWLGFLLLRQAWTIGMAEAAMVALTLVFVVGLPLALPVLGWAARRQGTSHVPGIVPMAGGKVP
jgi:hypothetical protein